VQHDGITRRRCGATLWCNHTQYTDSQLIPWFSPHYTYTIHLFIFSLDVKLLVMKCASFTNIGFEKFGFPSLVVGRVL